MVCHESPYLLLPRRSLPVACRELHLKRGLAAPPCEACILIDICNRAAEEAEGTAANLLQGRNLKEGIRDAAPTAV